ncbi:hypothetical protein [Streptomyces sp. NPDC086023]|uniref:hypothetical protein n=1 Tax=Streptomyces sp. NPDC086023 TaxID=3365746 RepID=UPI0037D8522E
MSQPPDAPSLVSVTYTLKQVGAALEQLAEAVQAHVQAVRQLAGIAAAPQHLGAGANAEDCPACARYVHNIAYPFICPGTTPPKEPRP